MISRVELKGSSSGTQYLSCAINKTDLKPFLEQLKEYVGLAAYDSIVENKLKRDGDEYHITVLYGEELKLLREDQLISSLGSAVEFKTIGLGLASKEANTAYFVTVESEDLNKIRDMGNLPLKDLHITLGFIGSDVHGVPKGASTLITIGN
ncbi:hypothetical protein [Vibrio sp. 10N.239.312.D08]|uniref:hypothetical protein n=1 Tax=Vibrio sp. 10N.239.312.D08 TaxID=3229978 RepID=UPI00354BFF4A